ncbi:hypothetical protein QYE76_060291 [Lolium multiflorum]|uniref:Transposase (putative) gypsy type domain-containing protein n=1 Tax=Lolium multiflorum TaxID=4521 RepID=A0AAD8RYI5_LOLMU|nr:hypothetical protein QYE76_060291 [Lolium multiflorum]
MVACTTTEMELKNLESEGFLQPGSWRSVPDELAPAPRDDEMVTKALVERGFSFPPSDFFLEILKTYGLQPHNISPNSVLSISNHVALCEGHLRLEALEENELGTLLRVPSTSNADPEAASEAEAPEASRLRKKPAPSSPPLLQTFRVNVHFRDPSPDSTLALILVCFLLKLRKPAPKAPKTLKKRTKPSPASFPITPEVEVPPKASSTSKPDPKDIINIDDLPKTPLIMATPPRGPPHQFLRRINQAPFAGPKKEQEQRLSSFK